MTNTATTIDETVVENSLPQSTAQPKALKILFGTELWERFAYFAIQSILVLCMTQRLGFSDTQAYLTYSAFTALLFVTPLIGGYVADKILGFSNAAIIGLIILITGYFLLVPLSPHLLIPALTMLTIGNGLFKPNISSLLGSMYHKNDRRREIGFTLFYIGINIGATIGVISCGFIAKSVGWSMAIVTAACGLIIGTLIFTLQQNAVHRDIVTKDNIKVINNLLPQTLKLTTLLVAIFAGIFFLIQHAKLANLALITSSVLLLAFLLYQWKKCAVVERSKFTVCIVLIIFSIAFWALYQQSFMSLMLYISRDVDLSVAGFSIPASVITAFNGIFLILLAPVMIKTFSSLAKRNRDLNVIIKFALGIGLMGVGYLVLFVDTEGVSAKHLASLTPIILSYGIQTIGELLLSPIGLAMVTEFAPEKIRGFMVGVWFFALAAATAISGQLSRLTGNAEHAKIGIAAHIYGHAFLVYGMVAIGVALLLWLLSLKLQRI